MDLLDIRCGSDWLLDSTIGPGNWPSCETVHSLPHGASTRAENNQKPDAVHVVAWTQFTLSRQAIAMFCAQTKTPACSRRSGSLKGGLSPYLPWNPSTNSDEPGRSIRGSLSTNKVQGRYSGDGCAEREPSISSGGIAASRRHHSPRVRYQRRSRSCLGSRLQLPYRSRDATLNICCPAFPCPSNPLNKC